MMRRPCLLALPFLAASIARGAQTPEEARAEADIRQALAGWVEAANRGDWKTALKVWAPDLIGWYPGMPDDTYAREAENAGQRVQAIHRHVRGTDPVTNRTYSADDPELLVWVHTVEIHSFLAAYRRYGSSRLTDAEADRYVAEQVDVAALVGTPTALVPASCAQVREYFASVEDVLRPSPYSRDAARVVLNPPLPLPLRVLQPIAWVPGAAAAGLMPRRFRAMHGIPWLPPADAAVQVAATALTRAMGVLPDPPHVRAARARWAEAA